MPRDRLRAIVFGATGMVGQGVVQASLADPRLTSLLLVGRSPSGVRHDKVTELIHRDFFDVSGIEGPLTGYDACFFCLGVSAAGMAEADYHRLTHDLTLEVAKTLVNRNPAMTFCYLSAAGADSSERGRMMWARVKGRIENALLGLGFEAVYLFRPGLIQPLGGIKSRTRVYRLTYALLTPFFPVFHAVAPGTLTTTDRLGRAMIQAAAEGYPRPILETKDINTLAG